MVRISHLFSLQLIFPLGYHLKGIVDVQVQKHLGQNQLLSAVCADNEANVQKAGQLLTHGENYGCAAHTAQLVTGAVIQQHLQQLTDRCRVCRGVWLFLSILTYFRLLLISFETLQRMLLH